MPRSADLARAVRTSIGRATIPWRRRSLDFWAWSSIRIVRVFSGPALADAITGIYAAYGILGALLERTRTHTGRHVEVSMLEAMAHFAVEPFAAFFALGVNPKSSDRPRLAQAYILQTADEQLIAIHLSSLEKFWTGLVSCRGGRTSQ